MYCVNHETEVLSKFCNDHGNTICDLCFLTTHRKCNVQVLNDIAKEEGVNNEITEFISNIKQTISSFEEIKKSREQDKEKIIQCSKSVREEVDRIKSDILSWVEQLERKTEEELCAKEIRLMGEIENHIKVCDQVQKQLNLVLASIEKLDVGDQNIRFTILVKSKASVEDGEKMMKEISGEITQVDFKLYRSDQLIKSMAEICDMGSIQGIELPKVDINFLDISSTEIVKQPEVFNGWVTGCAIMLDEKIVICEGEKEEFVKVLTPNFEIRNKILMESDTGIWDVAAIGPDEVVVTGAYSKKLFFFDISKGIVLKKSVELDIPCYGITYSGANIFVSCDNDEAKERNRIQILTVDGTYVSSFNTIQGFPYYIAVNSDLSRISTSTDTESSVQTFDRDGTLINTYTDSQLKSSLGILFDRTDNILVCGDKSNNIHVVKRDGTKHKILLKGSDGLSSPYCLAYRPSDKTLVVGLREPPFLLAFRMK